MFSWRGRAAADKGAEETMYQGSSFSRFSLAAILTAGLLLNGSLSLAQTKPAAMPDAQVEANVLKALAGAPELADQSITSTTVYGTVTLNGTVRDEPSRDLAEHLVANTAGVQKVVDQLVIGATPAAVGNDSQQMGTNPTLQSDGTMAPPQQGQSQQTQGYPNQTGAPQGRAPPPAYAPPYPQAYPPQQPYVPQKGGDAVVVPTGSVLRVRINQGMSSKNTTPGTPF